MPYSDKAEYIHYRQLPPEDFSGNYRTVLVKKLSKKIYSGKKFRKAGIKARVALHKYWHEFKVQSFLVPKGIKI